MPYVVGPFADGEPGVADFAPPEWSVGAALDISSEWTAWLKPGSMVDRAFRPTGVFFAESLPSGLSADYQTLADGSVLPTLAARDLWTRTTGFQCPDGVAARDILGQTLRNCSGNDSHADRLKAFTPNRQNRIDIVVGSRVIHSENWDDPDLWREFVTCKRLDLQSMAVVGGVSLAVACKQVGFLLRRWPETTDSTWITSESRAAGLKAMAPATTINDDFSGTLSAWTTKGGTMAIVSGVAHGQDNSSNNWMTHQTALSSTDHYSEAITNRNGGGNIIGGPFSRHDNSSAQTYYEAMTGGSSTQGRHLYKYVAGTGTQLAYASGNAYSETIRMDSDGSTQSAEYSTSSNLSASDSTITSGSYTGVRAYNYSTTDATFDDFEASDGAALTLAFGTPPNAEATAQSLTLQTPLTMSFPAPPNADATTQEPSLSTSLVMSFGATPNAEATASTVQMWNTSQADLPPNVILGSTNLTGATVANLDDDPDSPDGNWATKVSDANTEVHAGFATPSGVLVGQQTFRAAVRESASGLPDDPTVRIELWEDGVLVRAGSEDSTSEGGSVVTFTWDASEVSSSVDAEIKIIGTVGSGEFRTIEIGAIEWIANTADGSAITFEASPNAEATAQSLTMSSAGLSLTFGTPPNADATPKSMTLSQVQELFFGTPPNADAEPQSLVMTSGATLLFGTPPNAEATTLTPTLSTPLMLSLGTPPNVEATALAMSFTPPAVLSVGTAAVEYTAHAVSFTRLPRITSMRGVTIAVATMVDVTIEG